VIALCVSRSAVTHPGPRVLALTTRLEALARIGIHQGHVVPAAADARSGAFATDRLPTGQALSARPGIAWSDPLTSA
jgi:hypothetical protein